MVFALWSSKDLMDPDLRICACAKFRLGVIEDVGSAVGFGEEGGSVAAVPGEGAGAIPGEGPDEGSPAPAVPVRTPSASFFGDRDEPNILFADANIPFFFFFGCEDVSVGSFAFRSALLFC